MIVIVENGGSNINSVKFALDRLGHQAVLSDQPDMIEKADHVILPGVGAAAPGMSALHQKELIQCIQNLSQPVLGVCLGMQLLFAHSDEGDTNCLNIFEGTVKHLPREKGLTVPHMGWNQLDVTRTDNPILKGLDGAYFYFVHSYAAPVNNYCSGTSTHGRPFCATAWKDNFFATQFHPEKSASAGSRLLQQFVSL